MMGPPPGMPWDPGMGRGFTPGFRDNFPGGLGRPGSESPGHVHSDEDSEFGSSDEERKRDREHRKRDRDRDREKSRERRDR